MDGLEETKDLARRDFRDGKTLLAGGVKKVDSAAEAGPFFVSYFSSRVVSELLSIATGRKLEFEVGTFSSEFKNVFPSIS